VSRTVVSARRSGSSWLARERAADAVTGVTGLVCLQGGGEFSPGCRTMDEQVLHQVRPGDGGRPRVVVTALAGAPGREAATAEQHAVVHYRALGADAVAAPDARHDPDGALHTLGGADLVVLPGGSPTRLLGALRTTPVGGWLSRAVAGGTAVSGASAGAMLLCGWTVLPDAVDGLTAVRGLGVVDGVVVVPHWSGDAGRPDWLRAIAAAVPEGTEVLGLPERSGVLLSQGRLTAVGERPTRLLHQQRDLAPGDGWARRPAGRVLTGTDARGCDDRPAAGPRGIG
jgi:cyanophycinase-like exopeptidase